MRIFIDTDVLLDVLLGREQYLDKSSVVVDWAERNPGCAAVSWHGLANIHYLSRDGAEAFIVDLLRFAEIPRTGTASMLEAVEMKFSDLEDAMQVSAALLFEADLIVTRNVRDFRNARVKELTPAEFSELPESL
jgi:predicted nucleic acid-binding protein